jgi:hypothetical protein
VPLQRAWQYAPVSDDEARLSDEEAQTLFALLRRYCSVELDQFENWRTATPYSEVFITVSRHPAPGATADMYDSIG